MYSRPKSIELFTKRNSLGIYIRFVSAISFCAWIKLQFKMKKYLSINVKYKRKVNKRCLNYITVFAIFALISHKSTLVLSTLCLRCLVPFSYSDFLDEPTLKVKQWWQKEHKQRCWLRNGKIHGTYI